MIAEIGEASQNMYIYTGGKKQQNSISATSIWPCWHWETATIFNEYRDGRKSSFSVLWLW